MEDHILVKSSFSGHRMQRIAFFVVVVATLAVVIASMVPASGQVDKGANPIFVTQIPPGYRDWTVISVAHEEGNLNSLGAILGNAVAIKAYREGKLPYPDGTIIAALHWRHAPSEENNKIFGRRQSFVAGPPRTFSLWSRTQKNTPRRAAGGSVISTSATATNLATRRCSTPAFPATRRPKIATSSSPDTHRDTESHWTSPAHDQWKLTTTKVSEIGAASDATVCLPTTQGVASAPSNPLQQMTAAVRPRAVQRRTSGSHC